jgi:hypothetical protein
MNCEYCKNEFEDYDLRPYGHNGALICFDCAMRPENKAEVEKNFGMQIEAAEEAALNRVVVIGEHTGPRPLKPKSLV